ncbi:DNA-directed DNA polymerase [Tanacetum coccineum]
MEAIRIFLAFATYMNFIVFHMDVKSAYLNGKLKEEVYVKQPPGFESSKFPDYVCKLDKALYGLKQAPKAWRCPPCPSVSVCARVDRDVHHLTYDPEVERSARYEAGKQLELFLLTGLAGLKELFTEMSDDDANEAQIPTTGVDSYYSTQGNFEIFADWAPSNEEVNGVYGNRPRNDPFSESYNPGWRNHPNFRWKDDDNYNRHNNTQQQYHGYKPRYEGGDSSNFQQNSYQQRPQQYQNHGQGPSNGQQSNVDQKFDLILSELAKSNQGANLKFESLSKSVVNLERQMGQLAEEVHKREAGSSFRGMLGDFQANKEQSFPLLSEYQAKSPAYAKFLKDLCTQKRKLKATLPKKIDLTEHVSAVLSSSLPPKFKDPGAPLISIVVGNIAIKKATPLISVDVIDEEVQKHAPRTLKDDPLDFYLTGENEEILNVAEVQEIQECLVSSLDHQRPPWSYKVEPLPANFDTAKSRRLSSGDGQIADLKESVLIMYAPNFTDPDVKPSRDAQRRLNPNMKEVVKI